MKILTVIGARPQFIKASAVSRAIKASNHEEVILHTGQHFDEKMSQIFFDELSIPVPKYNLELHGLSHGAMTGKMLEGIEKVLQEEKPDTVLVYGDTNSTLAGALAASKLQIRVAHVEAGLRSYNMKMPEEINRILTDRISNLLFCPTEGAMENLVKEGYDQMDLKFFNTGDVMYDTTLHYSQLIRWDTEVLKKYHGTEYILCTIHRAENTDDEKRLKRIVNGLNQIAASTKVLVPLHPRTTKIIQQLKLSVDFEIIQPVGYLDMLGLIHNSQLVMTDSGGLQKEAFFLNKYCITLRDETEWTELVKNSFNFLVGADEDLMVQKCQELFGKRLYHKLNLYGDGHAAEKVVQLLESYIL